MRAFGAFWGDAPASALFVPDEALAAAYTRARHTHQLAQFASVRELQSVHSALLGEQQGHEKLRREKYLASLKCLLCCEELQADLEAVSTDLHNVMIHFEQHLLTGQSTWDVPGTLWAQIVVPGSSENRPRVEIGTLVRIRGELNGRRFELQGAVVRYVLAKETALCEFAWPVAEVRQALLSGMHVNVRFCHDTFHLLLMQQTLDVLLPWRRESDAPWYTLGNSNAATGRCSDHAAAAMERLFPVNKSLNLLATTLKAGGKDAAGAAPDMGLLNPEQLHAVNAVCQMVAMEGPLPPLPPFVIFGPPGTGKTATLIHTVVELCRRHPTISILLCAPSEAAADVLAHRLIDSNRFESAANPAVPSGLSGAASGSHVPRSKLLRLMWWQRSVAFVPPRVRPFCVTSGGDESAGIDPLFDLPTTKLLRSCNVVVSTCWVAGAMWPMKGDRRSADPVVTFDCTIIDEASQALEAEAFIPLLHCRMGATSPGAGGRGVGPGVMVLAGDVNQLGPATRSPLFKLCKVSSMQERLLRLPQYQSCVPGPNVALGSTNSLLAVFLHRNYRSHQDILQLPSALFYGSALRACGQQQLLECCLNWGRTPADAPFPEWRPEFTCQFVSVPLGRQQHAVDSPSFFNVREGETVVSLCRVLCAATLSSVGGDRGAGPARLGPKDIGVICAFRQQVLRVRKLLRDAGLRDVVVGSVEDFQGQEFKVVITSTVSSPTSVTPSVSRQPGSASAPEGDVGLLGDPRRFNVAVTRAMCLNIVVGHPVALSRDRMWRQYIDMCYAHDAAVYIDAEAAMGAGIGAEACVGGDMHAAGEMGTLTAELDAFRNAHLTKIGARGGKWRRGEGGDGEFEAMMTDVDIKVHAYHDIGAYLNELADAGQGLSVTCGAVGASPVGLSGGAGAGDAVARSFLTDLSWRDTK